MEKFYPSANITLDGLVGDSCIWSTRFFKADVAKNEGIFPQHPGYLYYSESVIREFDEFGFLAGAFRNIDNFRLSVEVPNHNVTYSASVPVYHPNFIASPQNGRKINLYGSKELERSYNWTTDTWFDCLEPNYTKS